MFWQGSGMFEGVWNITEGFQDCLGEGIRTFLWDLRGSGMFKFGVVQEMFQCCSGGNVQVTRVRTFWWDSRMCKGYQIILQGFWNVKVKESGASLQKHFLTYLSFKGRKKSDLMAASYPMFDFVSHLNFLKLNSSIGTCPIMSVSVTACILDKYMSLTRQLVIMDKKFNLTLMSRRYHVGGREDTLGGQ